MTENNLNLVKSLIVSGDKISDAVWIHATLWLLQNHSVYRHLLNESHFLINGVIRCKVS